MPKSNGRLRDGRNLLADRLTPVRRYSRWHAIPGGYAHHRVALNVASQLRCGRLSRPGGRWKFRAAGRRVEALYLGR